MTRGRIDTLYKPCEIHNVAWNTKRWSFVIINDLIVYYDNNDPKNIRQFFTLLAESIIEDHVERRTNQVKEELRKKILERRIPAEKEFRKTIKTEGKKELLAVTKKK